MRKFALLYLVSIVASAAFATSTLAATYQTGAVKVLSAKAGHVHVSSSGFKPFGPLCVVNSVSYKLFGKGSAYFVQFSGAGSCDNTASPWNNWQYNGTTPNGWMLNGYSYQPVVTVPVRELGKNFSISYTIGDDTAGSQTCSFKPNFRLGYTAVQLCR